MNLDTKNIPEELKKELPGYKPDTDDYTGRDLVLAYMAHVNKPVTTTDLLLYVYAASGQVLKRSYLYQLLYRLRAAGEIETVESTASRKTFKATTNGRHVARAYVTVPVKSA